MGFDLIGRNPKSKTGEYFHNNCWWWRPLASYVLMNVPISHNECKRWGTNDGQKVSDRTALRIAKRLRELIASGHTARHEIKIREQNKSEKFQYPFDVENVKEFAKFCDESGGFEIC